MTYKACKFPQTSNYIYSLLGHSSKRFLKFFYKNLFNPYAESYLEESHRRFLTCNTLTQQYILALHSFSFPVILTFLPTLSRTPHTITILPKNKSYRNWHLMVQAIHSHFHHTKIFHNWRMKNKLHAPYNNLLTQRPWHQKSEYMYNSLSIFQNTVG